MCNKQTKVSSNHMSTGFNQAVLAPDDEISVVSRPRPTNVIQPEVLAATLHTYINIFVPRIYFQSKG